jgi:RES domain-containing protein
VRVWRICRKAHAADPLGGRGGLYAPGRWHQQGVRIVYTSATLSLAALELLVHVDRDLLPSDLVQIEIDLPDDLPMEQIKAGRLPSGWRRYPAPAALQRMGAAFIERGKTAVLRVPSAVIPDEDNLLLNSAHPAIERLKIAGRRAFVLDPRLGK